MAKARPRAWRACIELVAMAALGGLQSLSYAHSAAWPLQWLCIAVLAWRVSAAAPGWAAALGSAYGTAWLATAVWWLSLIHI